MMNRLFLPIVGCLVAALFVAPVGAVFKCEKKDGGTRYVSEPEACQNPREVVSYEKKSAPPDEVESSPPDEVSPPATVKPPLSVAKPRQLHARDKKRGEILLHELRSERFWFNRWTEKTNAAAGDKRRKFKAQRQLHARNIIAIRQELARLGIYVGHSGN